MERSMAGEPETRGSDATPEEIVALGEDEVRRFYDLLDPPIDTLTDEQRVVVIGRAPRDPPA
jgi:hypothetical protein